MGWWEDELCEGPTEGDPIPRRPRATRDGTARQNIHDGSYEVYRVGRGWVADDEEEGE